MSDTLVHDASQPVDPKQRDRAGFCFVNRGRMLFWSGRKVTFERLRALRVAPARVAEQFVHAAKKFELRNR